MSDTVPPSNARRPVSISKNTHPNAQTSERRSTDVSTRLLGAHVCGRAEDDPGASHRRTGDGQGLRKQVRRRSRRIRRERLGQAEVEHLDGTIRSELDVGGLEVPVDDTGVVGRLQRLGNLPGDWQGLVERNWSLRDAFGQRPPFDQFQDKRMLVGSGVSAAFFQAVDGRDVGMIERREHLGLALEPDEPVTIVDEGLGEDLQRDIAAELCIGRPVHPSHTALAEESDDVVVPEPVPDVHEHAFEL